MSWFQAAIRDEWDGLERIGRDLRPADAVTILNALTGFFATYLAATGYPTQAATLILIAIILDGLDGAVARLSGGGPLGGFLDTLADLSSFAIAPAMLITTWEASALLKGVTAGAFLVAVMLRLARFEALRERPPTLYFSGMSSPGGALVIAAVTLSTLPTWAMFGLAFVSAAFMISRIRYPKLRRELGAIAVLIIMVVLTFLLAGLNATYPVWALMGFMTAYLLAGPFYVLAKFGPSQ